MAFKPAGVDENGNFATRVQIRLAALFQAKDAELDALAALANQTDYGRAFLTLADQAALVAKLPTGTAAAVGLMRFATTAEVTTGTASDRAVTPVGFHANVPLAVQQLIDQLQLAIDAKPDSYDYASAIPNSTFTIYKVGGVWPSRPSARADLTFIWKGANPPPNIVTTGTAGALDGVDEHKIPVS